MRINTATARQQQAGQNGRVRYVSPGGLIPCPANSSIYRPVDAGDPGIIDLALDIKRHGVKEPLVATRDGYILSGHRRLAAAKALGLENVPVRTEAVSWANDRDRCIDLLVAYNAQRVKTPGELLAEEVVRVDPDVAHEQLRRHRLRKSDKSDFAGDVVTGTAKARKRISAAKRPYLDAVRRIIEEMRDFWPLSDRQVHYRLLNDPPLRHSAKPDSRYCNDRSSYGDLCDLLTRARLIGEIPWAAIEDSTRPVIYNPGWSDVQAFVRNDLDALFWGYRRDLQQSQPAHIEVVAEKLTVQGILAPVCNEYGVSLTIGRGFPSSDARYRLAQRFFASGKQWLVLLVVCDCDPEGDSIPETIVGSLRSDFGVTHCDAYKVALTMIQVQTMKLPPTMDAKRTSTRFSAFKEKHGRHGDHAYELEALPPQVLQRTLRDSIESVIDRRMFNSEIECEKRDAAFLEATRRRLVANLKLLGLDRDEQGEA